MLLRAVALCALASCGGAVPTTHTVGSQAARLAGRVVSLGKPVAGATVHLAVTTNIIRDTRTDADGRFDLGLPPEIPFIVGAQAPGLRPSSSSFDPRSPTRGWPGRIELALGTCQATIHGRIESGSTTFDDHGERPVVGARVQTLWPLAVTYTDVKGRYSLCAGASQGVLDVEAEGFERTRRPFQLIHDTPVDLVLADEMVLLGTVRDALGPVPGATVTVESFARTDGSLSVLADARGRFAVHGLNRARIFYRLRATAAGKVGVVAAHLPSASRREPVPRFDIAVSPSTTVRGRVTPAVGGIEVILSDIHGPVARGVSQPDGSFTVIGAPMQVLRVSVAGYQASPEIIDARVSAPVAALAISAHAAFVGRVTRRGVPVAGAQVKAQKRFVAETSTVTDDDGRFVIADLDEGTYDVIAAGREIGAWDYQDGVVLGTGESKTLAFELSHAASIAGTLVDTVGHPIAGARLHLMRADDMDAADRRYREVKQRGGFSFCSRWDDGLPGLAITDEEGRFEVDGFGGNADYAIEFIRASHPNSEVLPPPPGQASPRIHLDGPASRVTGWQVVAVAADRHIRGTVYYNGHPLAATEILTYPQEEYRDQHEQFVRATADASGRFDLGGLHDGVYGLEVSSYTLRIHTSVSVRSGSSDVRIDLPFPRPSGARTGPAEPTTKTSGTATVTGFAHGVGGGPVAGALCSTSLIHDSGVFSDASGRFTLTVPARVDEQLKCVDREGRESAPMTVTLSPDQVFHADVLVRRP